MLLTLDECPPEGFPHTDALIVGPALAAGGVVYLFLPTPRDLSVPCLVLVVATVAVDAAVNALVTARRAPRGTGTDQTVRWWRMNRGPAGAPTTIDVLGVPGPQPPAPPGSPGS